MPDVFIFVLTQRRLVMFGKLLFIRLVVDETILDFEISLEKYCSINDPVVIKHVQDLKSKWKAQSVAFKLGASV